MPKKGHIFSDEWRKHQSEGQIRRFKENPHPLKGCTLPKEWCLNISKALKRFYSENEIWNLGISRSEETKRRMC